MPTGVSQLLDAAVSIFGVRLGEQPPHTVEGRAGQVEIRSYGARFAAETHVDAEGFEAMNEAFRILAGYIFGGNKQKQDIAMTAPVVSDQGTNIAMTTPVTTERVGESGLTMRFFLPAKITTANAPSPNDPRVTLTEIPPETVAVLRFSGRWHQGAFATQKQELLAQLANSGWTPIGEPFTQLYDPPFTIPFLRRNEVAVRVVPRR